MNPSKFGSVVLASLLCATFPLAASAAVFTYDGVVIRSPGPAATPADADFPPLGTVAHVQLLIDESDPSLVLDEALGLPDVPGFASASIEIPGYLSGETSYDPAEGLILGTEFRFAAYGPSILDNPGSYTFLDEGLNAIQVFFSDIDATPSTVAELVAAISKPGVHGIFRFEIEGVDSPEQFYNVHVSFPRAPGVIPLPATLVLFASAFAGLAAFRIGEDRKRKIS